MNQVKLFGSTIKETIDALRGRSYIEWKVVYPELVGKDTNDDVLHASPPHNQRKSNEQLITKRLDRENKIKAIMRLFITVVLLALAIYLLVTRKEDDDNSIPSVIIGAITGYWLK